MRPDNGTVNDDPILIDFKLQLSKELFPMSLNSPAIEPVIHGFPRAEALGQVPPWASDPSSVQDRFHEEAVAAQGFRAPLTAGKQWLKATPLCFSQCMSSHSQFGSHLGSGLKLYFATVS